VFVCVGERVFDGETEGDCDCVGTFGTVDVNDVGMPVG
jgi:hypothetical protein